MITKYTTQQLIGMLALPWLIPDNIILPNMAIITQQGRQQVPMTTMALYATLLRHAQI